MKKLYEYYDDFGRCGEVRWLFVAEDTDIQRVCDAKVETTYYDVLGKHSEITVTAQMQDPTNKQYVGFRKVTSDPAFIAKFEELGCGHGPDIMSDLLAYVFDDVFPDVEEEE